MLMEQRTGAATLWYDQGDAAAGVEVKDEGLTVAAELETLGRREEDDEAKRYEGEK